MALLPQNPNELQLLTSNHGLHAGILAGRFGRMFKPQLRDAASIGGLRGKPNVNEAKLASDDHDETHFNPYQEKAVASHTNVT